MTSPNATIKAAATIRNAARRSGLRADACLNAGVIDAYPRVAETMLKAGWEFQGHGIHQQSLSESGEAELIGRTAEKLKAFTGQAPRGWIGPGLKESVDTRHDRDLRLGAQDRALRDRPRGPAQRRLGR